MTSSGRWRLRAKQIIIEAIAVLAIAAVLLGAVAFGRSWFMRGRDLTYIRIVEQHTSSLPLFQRGRQVDKRAGGGFSGKASLIAVLSPACAFCSQAVPAYRAIFDSARGLGVKIVVALPSKEKGAAYLSELRLGPELTADWEELSLRAEGTPELVFVNSSGEVIATWVGVIAREKIAEVVAVIQNPYGYQPPRRQTPDGEQLLTPGELAAVSGRRTVNILSISERGEFATEKYVTRAKNIPLDEIEVRAETELDRSALQVVDCTHFPDAICGVAQRILRIEGFETAGLDNSEEVHR